MSIGLVFGILECNGVIKQLECIMYLCNCLYICGRDQQYSKLKCHVELLLASFGAA